MKGNDVFDPVSILDSTISDPCILDPDFPPEQFVTHFLSHGSVVHATVWIAQGRRPRGTLILCPQMYGGDRLESVIIPLMTAGINVMTFHPRGMWDNQHIYTLTGAIDDLLAAAAYVRSTAKGDIRTPAGHAWRTDTDRIAVMGLSGGGGTVSISACAEDPLIQSVIAVAPANKSAPLPPEMIAGLEPVKARTAGRIDVVATMNAMTPAENDRMSPIIQAPRLVRKNMLLVGAMRDVVSPLDIAHRPIAQAMRDAGAQAFDEVILDTDHSFLTKRIALARLIIDWLRKRAGF